jgi:hypothetical protein
MDLFHEANGTLNDLLKAKLARLRLDHGDTGLAKVKKITDSRERRKARRAKEDGAEDKGEGSLKGK